MSRKITNDCFIFNGFRQVCVLCEIMMMMMLSYRSESTVVLREVVCTVLASELACACSLLPAYVDSVLYCTVENIMHGEKYNRDS